MSAKPNRDRRRLGRQQVGQAPWRRAYVPVKIEARLVQQMEVVTNPLWNRTPSRAKRSMFGVQTSWLR
jgi:hypothetical protein